MALKKTESQCSFLQALTLVDKYSEKGIDTSRIYIKVGILHAISKRVGAGLSLSCLQPAILNYHFNFATEANGGSRLSAASQCIVLRS